MYVIYTEKINAVTRSKRKNRRGNDLNEDEPDTFSLIAGGKIKTKISCRDPDIPYTTFTTICFSRFRNNRYS